MILRNRKHFNLKSQKYFPQIMLKKLLDLQKDFKKLVMTLNKDFKSGIILNLDPIPIAVTHSAMTIWVELLKNKYNLKNQKINSQNIIIGFTLNQKDLLE